MKDGRRGFRSAVGTRSQLSRLTQAAARMGMTRRAFMVPLASGTEVAIVTPNKRIDQLARSDRLLSSNPRPAPHAVYGLDRRPPEVPYGHGPARAGTEDESLAQSPGGRPGLTVCLLGARNQ